MPENRDQGIGLKGTVKNEIVAVFIVSPQDGSPQLGRHITVSLSRKGGVVKQDRRSMEAKVRRKEARGKARGIAEENDAPDSP